MNRTAYDTAAWIDLATDHSIRELKQRSSMLLFINIFGIAVTFGMAVPVLRQGYPLLAVNDVIVGTLLGFSLMLQLAFRRPAAAGYLTMGAAILLFLMFLVQAGPDNSALLWFNTYPLIVMFVLGRRHGLIASGAVAVLAAVMLLTPLQRLLLSDFSGQMKIRIFLTFGLTTYVAYVYESLRNKLNAVTYRAVDRLKETLERLSSVNRELQQFAALTSHDLQEPARKLAIFSKRLMKAATTDLPEPVIDNIVRIDNSIVRVNTQLAGLREYAWVVMEERRTASVDLNAVLAAVKRELADVIDREHASVFSDKLPTVRAGARHMSVLLRHLVENGVVHHRAGRYPMVSVTAEERRGDGAVRCDLHVRDNGAGIDERYRERVFDVFETCSGCDERTRAGIGLTVCRRLTEIYGGSLTVASTPGKGSTFTASIVYTEKPLITCEGE